MNKDDSTNLKCGPIIKCVCERERECVRERERGGERAKELKKHCFSAFSTV
jgi:hypothetical protein